MQSRWKSKGSGGAFKLPAGDTTIRILPNVRDREDAPLLEFLIHREVGPKKRMVRCGKDLDGKGSCWLCDKKIPELRASASAAKRAIAGGMGRWKRWGWSGAYSSVLKNLSNNIDVY
jgi:hypothetical protein